MSSFPPPDVAFDVPQLVSLSDVFIVIVGIIQEEPDVEILARTGTDFYRFCLPKSARVVREFWKNIGVTNTSKLPEGAYQDERGGCGPYSLTGMLIGEDIPIEEPTSDDASDDVSLVIEDTPAEPGRLDSILNRLAETEFPVGGEASIEEGVSDVVSVGTKVLLSVKMESTKPEPSGIVRTGGHVLKGRF